MFQSRVKSAVSGQASKIGLLAITLVFILFGIKDGAAQAPTPEEPAQGPLRIETVLKASATHFPSILEALAKRRGAAGDALSAQGAFDVVFSADGFDRVSGFFDGGVIDTKVERQFRPLGAKVFGSYRVSDGLFPTYENIENTNTLGEGKIGVIFSLLRDKNIDPRRFQELDTSLALRQADLDVLLTKVGVQYNALTAYWRWVAAGQQLSVFESLLQIARNRQSGLKEQVDQGARAAIFLTENLQNITRRQRLVTEAERDFEIAANELSFYYRDTLGQPLIPTRRQLPTLDLMEPLDVSMDLGGGITEDNGDLVMAALAARPELAILRTALDRARAKVQLSENELKPRLDLNAEVSRDFGEINEGGPSFDSTDTIVGFRFSVPFQRREAKGRLARARADFDAVEQARRRTQDRIELEVRNILINLTTSARIATIAGQETSQAETMERAERERFASGASDFFLVNVREETTADARIRELLAELQIHIARANYDAATVNLERLGLADSPYADIVGQ
ncbi:MAG: TolC family protein [Pseudomonadota bacterium]